VLPVALDAMGGDFAPAVAIEGARLATKAGAEVLLVGLPEVVSATGMPWEGAEQFVEMGEDPLRAVRTKKRASVVRAAELVRDGAASALVGAGNTGATMSAALLRMGRLRGVRRPAIATLLPAPRSDHETVLLDAGANAECSSEMLVQFAAMGAAYARVRYGTVRPRVALLNIGEEAGKGPPVLRAHRSALSDPRWQRAVDATFEGNGEGRDLFEGAFDVVVTDGFTGNVTLKALEGATTTIVGAIEDRLGSIPPSLTDLAERLDPDLQGGGVLLGLRGVGVIAHGASSPLALARAILFARDLVSGGVVEALEAAIAPLVAGDGGYGG